MARTKMTAKKSTGAPAPRVSLSTNKRKREVQSTDIDDEDDVPLSLLHGVPKKRAGIPPSTDVEMSSDESEHDNVSNVVSNSFYQC